MYVRTYIRYVSRYASVNSSIAYPPGCYALVIGFPKGGGTPGHMGKNWGLGNKFKPLWWGKCGGLGLERPDSLEKCGDFASGKARGDWEQVAFFVDRLRDGGGEGEECCVAIVHSFNSIICQ